MRSYRAEVLRVGATQARCPRCKAVFGQHVGLNCLEHLRGRVRHVSRLKKGWGGRGAPPHLPIPEILY